MYKQLKLVASQTDVMNLPPFSPVISTSQKKILLFSCSHEEDILGWQVFNYECLGQFSCCVPEPLRYSLRVIIP